MSRHRNNWDVKYSAISFVEDALATHARVEDFVRFDDIFFEIVRDGTLPPVNALLVNRYVIGQADVIQAKSEFPEMNCIVASGNWCGYTREAKEYGLKHGIGVFHVGEFFGALWHRDFVRYVQTDHKGRPMYAYMSSPDY